MNAGRLRRRLAALCRLHGTAPGAADGRNGRPFRDDSAFLAPAGSAAIRHPARPLPDAPHGAHHLPSITLDGSPAGTSPHRPTGSAPNERGTGRVRLVAVTVALVSSAWMVVQRPGARAATLSGTFYSNNRAPGSACSTPVRTSRAQPGARSTGQCNSFRRSSQILLERGDTFQQALEPSGSGTSSAWITIGRTAAGTVPSSPAPCGERSYDRPREPDYWRSRISTGPTPAKASTSNYTTDDPRRARHRAHLRPRSSRPYSTVRRPKPTFPPSTTPRPSAVESAARRYAESPLGRQ